MTRAAVGGAWETRVAIATRLGRGDSLDSVERELIAPSRLSEEQQAALWLYGWSLPKRTPADVARRPHLLVALGNALATFVGVCRH